jgi:integrase
MEVSMNNLKPQVKTYIQQNCPQGITLFRDKALYVKSSKTVNGEPKTLTKTISIGLDKSMSEAEMKTAFETALQTALNVKRQFTQQLNNPNFTSFHKPGVVATGKLNDVFVTMFNSEWGACSEKQQYLVKHFYKDLQEFFGSDKRLSDFQEEEIEDFKQWCAKKIAEREKNMTGSVSNNSINKRLGVLRSVMKYALKKRLLSNDQLINPDPRIKNMGIVDLPRGETKKKPAFTEWEQEQFLQVQNHLGDEFWYDIWAWAFDCGMRHEGELDGFTIDNIDFGRKTVTFWRPKTKTWSCDIPMTARMVKIAKRRMKDAQARPDRKVFPVSASSRRSNWNKVLRLCNFNNNFTPYTTRHTFITRLVEKGVGAKAVMDLAGHKCVQTTLTYYTKSTSTVLQDAMKALCNTRNDDSIDENADTMIGHNSRKALIK